jgi:1,4-alpha-glucan branching enzyme
LDSEADALVAGEHADPFGYLGPHVRDGALVVRAFLPGAARVEVREAATGAPVAAMSEVHAGGVWQADIRGRERFPYRLAVEWIGGVRDEIDDPYQYPPLLGELDLHLLAEGSHWQSYEKLGAHVATLGGAIGVRFAVWAPNARRVSLVGDFNLWDGRRHVMRLRHEAGIWELFVPGLKPGTLYKYEVKGADGVVRAKADPYAFEAEVPPRTASRVATPEMHVWGDGAWLSGRAARADVHAPISIYEVHLGSWRRDPADSDRMPTYRELAHTLVPYVADLGFTHVEFMPVAEHPFYGSWGYQPISLFAPSARFGSPADFCALVDAFHQAGIGVIVDWVPAHFPDDPHGLGLFDGTHLYEHADPRQGRHNDWGTLIYNMGRREVRNFLISSALFWLDRYHVDGLRVDAVASMLYLDYSRRAGEWIPNAYGGNANLEAIDFLRGFNGRVHQLFPGVVTVAEESTAWPGVSRPVEEGGLGFDYKWNMGWMHDTLSYMGQDPVHRRWHHDRMTFGLIYAWDERFVLPLSHDEVVYGKGSILARMPGDAWQKFANVRAYYTFMYGHPGKKLMFMGDEFAQGPEWNHDAALNWEQLDIAEHEGVRRLVRDLNRLYREMPALHARDAEPGGFAWVVGGDRSPGRARVRGRTTLRSSSSTSRRSRGRPIASVSHAAAIGASG